MFCPNCGKKCEDNALFCWNCGTKLPAAAGRSASAASGGQSAPVSAVPAASAPAGHSGPDAPAVRPAPAASASAAAPAVSAASAASAVPAAPIVPPVSAAPAAPGTASGTAAPGGAQSRYAKESGGRMAEGVLFTNLRALSRKFGTDAGAVRKLLAAYAEASLTHGIRYHIIDAADYCSHRYLAATVCPL